MQETPLFFQQLEWPAPEARVAGPVVWLRGWAVAKAGMTFLDVRALCATGVHLGIFGLPRTDLAAHFNSSTRWLPAEYVIGVPLPDGPADVTVEARDESGNWHRLESLKLIVASEGTTNGRIEGELTLHPGGSSTSRVPHLPFHGHLDETKEPITVRDGQIELFGWLLHETQIVRRVFASLDLRVLNALASGITDDSLASKVPHLPAARHARLQGRVDAPPTLFNPACLRVYAELADGSVHLSFARRLNLPAAVLPVAPATKGVPPATGKLLPPLPSGRPRRLLMIVRSLQPDDATLRALDVAGHLIASGHWALRLIASEDGPLRAKFEVAECPAQIIDPRAFFAATGANEADAARQKIGREIWWKHLDGMAVFDAGSTWAAPLAHQHHLPVFHDPAEFIAWFSPLPIFTVDNHGAFVAPIRGLAAHGAGILLHAAAQLARQPVEPPIVLTDVRGTPEEILFFESRCAASEKFPALSRKDAAAINAAAAVICPAFREHPNRALLSALAVGVPVIATPSPMLDTEFGPNEISVVPPGNPLALANAIIDLQANPVARDRRAAAAMRIASAKYSPADQLPRWRAMMEEAFGA